ncbi:TIGR01212 family radical SAM protein [Reinekea thalattae]|uniref:TIGR01212 family radical SAM protein n=1 Tax=Reinekea thalattae TaxID=2593301 RepID=A0A5C8Z827_9GAMM|nr:TIGR01212 family radical SAM protein [Reinekea thalattae]TXR53807.1 TIGR01212 family radical SAM protein [Reinekea thalattae]
MALNDYVTTFGQYLKAKYGEKIYKLSLHANVTCPNRDGSKGIGGCTFCNNKSFFPNHMNANASISEQIECNVVQLQKKTQAKKFLAYFQAYSNTYGDIEYLKKIYVESLKPDCVIGLCVGTRPDCISNDVLNLLQKIKDLGFEVWIELGLQSAHDVTLERVNRGHTFVEYQDAVRRIKNAKINLCTHLIAGLPGENKSMILDSWQQVLNEGVQGIKWHPLHIVKGTQLARQWRQGEYQPITQEDYIDIVSDALAATPAEVIVHRAMSTVAQKQLLLAPHWTENRWPIMTGIEAKLAQAKQLKTSA